MPTMKDWSGTSFGYIKLIKFLRSEVINKRHEYIYECECVCGITKEVKISNLKAGRTNSCGCLRKKLQSERKIKPDGYAATTCLFKTYQEKAIERGYSFNLTREQVIKLLAGNCFFCGKEPLQIKKSKRSQLIYNGIDRVDNSKGYSIENCVSCCGPCNSNKSGVTIDMCKKILEFVNEK